MDDLMAEAYTLECGLILTWVGHEATGLPSRDLSMPVWASRRIAELLRREFARRTAVGYEESPESRRLFAQGLWCQLYTPGDYADLDVAGTVQQLITCLVSTRARGSVYGGLSPRRSPGPNTPVALCGGSTCSSLRILPLGLLGTAPELVRVQQGRTPSLMFQAIGAILKRAFHVPPGISFMCLPRFFFGEELMKTAALLEDILSEDDGSLELADDAAADPDPVLV